MKVRDVMTRGVECVRPDTTIQEAAAKMKAMDVGSMPVCEGDRVAGILTDRDMVLRGVAEGRDLRTTRVQELMTRDVFAVSEDDDLKEVARVMKERQIRRVIVLGGERALRGIVSLGDIAVEAGSDKLSGDVLERVSRNPETVGKRG